jgi:uncharacterized protein Yka (UPF0111/DUF47 family)
MAEKIPSWVALLLARLSSMERELKAINSEIKKMERKIDSLDDRFNTGINALSEKADVLRNMEGGPSF